LDPALERLGRVKWPKYRKMGQNHPLVYCKKIFLKKEEEYFLIILMFFVITGRLLQGEMIKPGRTRHGVGQGILGMIHSQSLPERYFG